MPFKMKKKIICISFALILLNASCDGDCNDCNPYISQTYSIKSTLNENVRMVFFRNSGQQSEVILDSNSSEILYQISRVSQSGLLSVEPFAFDSLKIFSGSNILYDFDRSDNCEIPSNALCEENFIKVSEEKDNADNTFVEYRLDLK